MKQYLDLIQDILQNGFDCPQRATVGGKPITARTIPGLHFRHDMSAGFPLVTTKKIPFHLIASELWFFIQGRHRKEDLHQFGNHIWDEWRAPNQDDPNELGRGYGVQWRDWSEYGFDPDSRYGYVREIGIDQLQNVLRILKKNPWDRRMVVTAWNPAELDQMAIPPCHMLWNVTVTPPRDPKGNGKNVLSLSCVMRSADMMLGVPFNIASYGLLLMILAKHADMAPGWLSMTFNNAHIYQNHIEAAEAQVKRQPLILPWVEVLEKPGQEFDILKWDPTEVALLNYAHHPAIKMEVAV